MLTKVSFLINGDTSITSSFNWPCIKLPSKSLNSNVLSSAKLAFNRSAIRLPFKISSIVINCICGCCRPKFPSKFSFNKINQFEFAIIIIIIIVIFTNSFPDWTTWWRTWSQNKWKWWPEKRWECLANFDRHCLPLRQVPWNFQILEDVKMGVINKVDQ